MPATSFDIEVQPVSNLVQGVSQQAAQQRRDSQCEAQFDCINSPSEGVDARPGARFVKLFAAADYSKAFFSEIVRGTENYVVGINGTAVFSINLDTGVLGSITGSNTDGYLDAIVGVDNRDKFRAITVEDTTFLLNRRIAPLMDSTILSPVRYPEALVFVRNGGAGFGYEITVTGKDGNTDDALSQYNTPGPGLTATSSLGTTTIIADRLTNGGVQGDDQLGFPDPTDGIDGQNDYRAVRAGSIIKIDRADHGDFDVATADGNGDSFMYAFKDKAQSFAKLPAYGFDGFILEVNGDDRSKADNYFVQFMGPSSTGFWDEITAPNTETTLKKITMPHTVVLTAPNAFTYSSKDWSTRIAGDTDTAPNPGFVGQFCRDLFYHENRLGILYPGGAVWSKARFPYTFFPDTVQAVLATAPVDVKLIPGKASRGASDQDFAVQIDESLFLWSPKAQFRISSGTDNFKQDSVASNVSTAYEYSPICDPLALGSFLYFPQDVGPYSAFQSVSFNNGKPNGQLTITGHVQKYLEAGIRYVVGSDTLNCMFALSDNDPTVLYCYNFLYQQNDYIQSAWNKWRIPGGNMLWASIKSNKLRILQQRAEGLALLEVDLTPKIVDDDLPANTYYTRLDLRVDQSQVTSAAYNSGANSYHFTLPYTPLVGTTIRVITKKDKVGGFTRGREFHVVSVVGAVVTVTGDLTGYEYYVGHRISSERTESRFFVRNDKGIVPFDRLTVDTFTVEFADTGYTRIKVEKPNKGPFEYVYDSRTTGLPSSVTGTPRIATSKLSAPVHELAENCTITLINDSFMPSRWQSASYGYQGVGKAGLK
jgi:hypothetical protein